MLSVCMCMRVRISTLLVWVLLLCLAAIVRSMRCIAKMLLLMVVLLLRRIRRVRCIVCCICTRVGGLLWSLCRCLLRLLRRLLLLLLLRWWWLPLGQGRWLPRRQRRLLRLRWRQLLLLLCPVPCGVLGVIVLLHRMVALCRQHVRGIAAAVLWRCR